MNLHITKIEFEFKHPETGKSSLVRVLRCPHTKQPIVWTPKGEVKMNTTAEAAAALAMLASPPHTPPKDEVLKDYIALVDRVTVAKR